MIADELLDGPRGRRLCWDLFEQPRAASLDDARQRVPAWVEALRNSPADVHAQRLFRALGLTVDAATYWQPPDDTDALLAGPEAAEALRPVAEALIARGVPDWWCAPLDPDGQFLVVFDGADAPPTSGVAQVLRDWVSAEDRAGAALAEHLATAEDPRAAWERTTGRWWSAPLVPAVPGTTRALPGVGPVALWLVEDFAGYRAASAWPVAPDRAPRVHEVDSPAAWAELVGRHPVDVGESRGPDWWRVTGRVGRWLVPDWPRVAEEFDAVRVSARGYLTTAGRVVPIDDGVASLLAGWSPDTTYWLTDVLAPSGPAVRWVSDDDGGWTLS